MAKRESDKEFTVAARQDDQGENRESVPVYFLSLRVENVLCFGPKQTLDLSNGKGAPVPWTIILGDNGVGKTTLLKCLAGCEFTETILIGSKDGGEERVMLPRGFREECIQDLLVRGQPEITTQLCSGSDLRSAINGKTQPHMGHTSIGRRYCSPIDSSFGSLRCYGYGASRRMARASLSESDETQNSESLLDEGSELINAEEWLLQADYAASKDSSPAQKFARRRDQIKEVLIKLLPDVSDIRITTPTKEGQVSFLEFQTPYGWVRLQALSLGYRSMIAWVVDLATRLFKRFPNSPDPLAEPAVVLVDEIDLHLHPSWQRKILAYLSERFPNTQFIATAHSPLVVQAVEDANVVLLRKEGDHVVIENNRESVRGWRVDQILTSDLFGLPSARSLKYEALMAEREQILSKPKLTARDDKKLADIRSQLEVWPVGENAEDREAMDIIRRAAQSLKKKEKAGS